MKNYLLVFLFAILFFGCKKDSNTSQPTEVINVVSGPIRITSFSPNDGISGSTVTIFGINFNPTTAKNIVKFGENSAVVTSATSTSLIVLVPKQAATSRITVTVNNITDTTVTSFDKIATISAFGGMQNSLGFLDGVGTSARFKYPLGIAVDRLGNIFVADLDNHCIRKITQSGVVTTFAGNGSPGHVDANGTSARLGSPYDIAFDSYGNLFVTESYDNDIRKITPSGDVTTFAGSGVAGYLNGNTTSAQFNFPWGITVDANDNIYVGDYNNRRLRKITSSGTVSTFAGNGLLFNQGGDMYSPRDMTIDSVGNLYVVGGECLAHIIKVTQTGIISSFFPPPPACTGWADGPLSIALFTQLNAVCRDKFGNFYVVDKGYNGNSEFIRKISSTGIVSTVANITGMSSPSLGIAADEIGNLYITKGYGGSVLKISL